MINRIRSSFDQFIVAVFARFYFGDIVFIFAIGAFPGTGNDFAGCLVYDLSFDGIYISRDQPDHVYFVRYAFVCISNIICRDISVCDRRDADCLIFVRQIFFSGPFNIILINRRIRVGEIDLYIRSQFLSCIFFHDIC